MFFLHGSKEYRSSGPTIPFQRHQLRPPNVKWLTQGHRVGKQQAWLHVLSKTCSQIQMLIGWWHKEVWGSSGAYPDFLLTLDTGLVDKSQGYHKECPFLLLDKSSLGYLKIHYMMCKLEHILMDGYTESWFHSLLGHWDCVIDLGVCDPGPIVLHRIVGTMGIPGHTGPLWGWIVFPGP